MANSLFIKTSTIQFKNPQVGQPTLSVAEHYNGRRITVDFDGDKRVFHFKPDEMSFIVSEDEMIVAIENKLMQETQHHKI